MIAFRVDRIIELEIMEDPSLPKPENFVMSDYARKIIEMFDGEEQDVELVCDNGLMKSVIDKFGENIHTERINENQFKETVTVTASKTLTRCGMKN